MNTQRAARTKRTSRKTEQISIKLDKETRDAFRDICEKEHRPEGQLARLAIMGFIKSYLQRPA